jgi:hypothetical protein
MDMRWLSWDRTQRKRVYSSSQTSQSNTNQCDNIGTASESDVSPNTPRADDSNL